MINPNAYTYRRNERGILIRNQDNILIPEDDPTNGAYILYQQWIAAGNAPIPGSPLPNWPHTPPPTPEPMPEPESVPQVKPTHAHSHDHGPHGHSHD